MNDSEIHDLLRAAGFLTDEHTVDGDAHVSPVIGLMDPLKNPTAVSALAQHLADALPGPKPDLITAWPGLPNVALAFAVGVSLDRPVTLLSDAEGLVTSSGSIDSAQTAALIGVTLSERDATLARAFVESKGGTLTIAASLIGCGEVDGEVCLVPLEDYTYAESDCPVCNG